MFVYSMTPPKRVAHTPDARTEHGESLFTEHCGYCHRDKNYGGLPVAAASIGTDPVLAKGSARGTGLYRPTPLLRVADAAPYFHDGSIATLAEILDPERSQAGHRYGVDLPPADRAAIVAFMETL
ncbi:MAG: c-type cytochrome [Myxococcales bacterium]|nr:c-type cytochrome [Myxococcales bacterium]